MARRVGHFQKRTEYRHPAIEISATCVSKFDPSMRDQTPFESLTKQKRKSITTQNPPRPLTTVLQKIPRAAVIEAFFVSSAMCPEASKPINIPAVARYDRHQFQPSGAPVPLYVVMKASYVERKPVV